MFKDKTLVITGGTGSFGNAVLRRFLGTNIGEIRIFSRDEKKQDDMRLRFANSKLRFLIGDVRDISAVRGAMSGADYVFHAAALKQVPSCEFNPWEAVKTNIGGTENVLSAAIDAKVKRVVCLSTDKAVYPINAMGMSKALMEKVARARALTAGDTTICVTRYGNVMASRGSVIPVFVRQVLSGKPITVTDPNMTRFMMTLDEAVDLVLHAFMHGKPGELFVQKSPAATMETLANAVRLVLDEPSHQIITIGTRHGEKVHETLLSREEMACAHDDKQYFRVSPDMRDLNYEKYLVNGDLRVSGMDEYNSENTRRLDIAAMAQILRTLPALKAHNLTQDLSADAA